MKISPISEAILEGAATVFERDKANSRPEWSKYYGKNEMLKLLNEVLGLKSNFDRNKWKYYDKQSGRSHLLYRVGTFIVDEALTNNPEMKIEDLIDKNASFILKLSKLTKN